MKIISVEKNPSIYTIHLSDEITVIYKSSEKNERQIISELQGKIFESITNLDKK